jgi:hypothetical protein
MAANALEGGCLERPSGASEGLGVRQRSLPISEEDGLRRVGSRKGIFDEPFVYIAAFWTEIVNAPEESLFGKGS